jgi:EpsI family protein
LRRQTPRIFPRALLLAIPALILWSLGDIVSINEAQQIAIVGFFQILVLTILGPAVYRTILFPCLFLFFLVPTGEYLVGPLQTFTTKFISVGLDLLGILHYTEGTVIQLVNGAFEVEEACAGLRFLIATVVLSVLFAHLTYRKWNKIAIFLLASFIIPVIGNGLRALGIVLIAHFTDNRLAVGADHLVYGWGFSVAILLVLFWIGARFRDEGADAPPAPVRDAMPPPVRSPFPLVAVSVAAALVISAGPAFAMWREQAPLSAASMAAFAATPTGWPPGWTVGKPSGAWEPSYAAPDAQSAFSIALPGIRAPVDVTVKFYRRNAKGHSLIESTNRMWDETYWHPVSTANAPAVLNGVAVKFSELIISTLAERRMIWWSYWKDGEFTTSGARIKLLSLHDPLRAHDGAALIAVSTPVDGTEEDARHRLSSAIAALNGLPARLNAVAQ